MFDVAIIGCGVIGAATAYMLSKYDLSVAVIEKENDVALGATRANSAIIHAGYDPEPGTLMAELNVKGSEMTEKLCRDLSVPYKRVGSLVLAFDDEQMNMIRELCQRGIKNGVKELSVIDREQLRKVEPNVSDKAVGALYAKTAGIINPWEYCLAFAEVAVQNGVKVFLDKEVTDIKNADGKYQICCGDDLIEARFVINAAGVNSDIIHNMVCEKEFTVKPCVGEYYLLDKSEGSRAEHVLFQCPGKMGKGVLVAPTVHGNLIAGPNAVNVDDHDCTETTLDGLNYVREMALKSVPSINFRNNIRNFAGLRSNTDKNDFIIKVSAERFIDLAGIKSPGLSSAPAIALEAVRLLKENGLQLNEKKDFTSTRKKVRFNELTPEQKTELIKERPEYGRVICRCETITEGEIIDALHSPLPACSIDGVKRRAGSGMGRCQGGFCGPKILEIIARELNISPLSVLKDRKGSYILSSETKTGGSL